MYKWNEYGDSVVETLIDGGTAEYPNSSPKYSEIISSGDPILPWKSEEDLKEYKLFGKLRELGVEYTKRVEDATGNPTASDTTKNLSKQMKLIRKEAKGNASQGDIDYLDEKDILDDSLDYLDTTNDEAEQYLEDPTRTLQEIEDYDVVSDPNWEV